MMDKIIGMIREVNSSLSGFEIADDTKKAQILEIESFIGKSLPDEIKSFLVNASPKLAESTIPILMGYEPISLESIVNMYRNSKDKLACQFLGGFQAIDQDLIVSEEEGIEQIQDLERELDDGYKILDMKRVIPILSGEGYFLVLLFNEDAKTEIAIVTEDFCISSVAPSIRDYLLNLEVGIHKKIYDIEIDEEYDEIEIDAPELWREKVNIVGKT